MSKLKDNIEIHYGGCVSLDLELRRIPFESALKILKFVANETGTTFDEPEITEQRNGKLTAVVTANEERGHSEISGSYPRSVSAEEAGFREACDTFSPDLPDVE